MKSDDMETITAEQIRAARALVRITAQELADAARVGVATVRRCEAEEGAVSATPANAYAIRTALESFGVRFLEDSGVALVPRPEEEPEPDFA